MGKSFIRVVGVTTVGLLVFALAVSWSLRDAGLDTVLIAWTWGLATSVAILALHGVFVRMIVHDAQAAHFTQKRAWRYVGALFMAHLLETELFGTSLYFAHLAGLGELTGATNQGYADYLYFSFAAYTSLGLGDISPTGPLRLLTGLETLTGLICIGWTTAALFGAISSPKGRS